MAAKLAPILDNEIPPKLRQRFHLGRVGLFIGAGAAKSKVQSGKEQLPTGGKVKEKLLERYYPEIESAKRETKFRQEFTSQLSLKAGQELTPEIIWGGILDPSGANLHHYVPILTELFDVGITIPPGYRYVAWLLSHGFLDFVATTNFDEKIDESILEEQGRQRLTWAPATNLERARAVRETRYPAILFSAEDFEKISVTNPRIALLMKLHGTLSHPFTIRSSHQDVEFFEETKTDRFLEALANVTTFIFIGYGGRDPDIHKALRAYAAERQGQGKKEQQFFYWVDHEFAKNPERDELVLALSAQRIRMESFAFLKGVYDSLKDDDEWEKEIRGKRLFLESSLADAGNLLKTIEDPVYQKLTFSSSLAADVGRIVASADFQRLRDIRQLSFVHYRYPGAMQTRFSHSLGVAHLAWKAAATLRRSGQIAPETARSIAMAGLLHDIGHGPFGHVLDKLGARIGHPHVHERKTIEIIENGIFDMPAALDFASCNRNEVKEILKATKGDGGALWYANVVGGHPLDFDRVDFVLRDALAIGLPSEIVPQGYQLERASEREQLLRTLYDNVTRVTLRDGSQRLGFRWSSDVVRALRFLSSLYGKLYHRVYFADTVFIAETMIAKALELGILVREFSPQSLYKFTDSGLFAALERSQSDLVRHLAWSVSYRRFFVEAAAMNVNGIPKHVDGVRSLESLIEENICKKFGLNEMNGLNEMAIAAIRKTKEPGIIHLIKNGDLKEFRTDQFVRNVNAARNVRILVSPNSKIFDRDNYERTLRDCVQEASATYKDEAREAKKTEKSEGA